MNSERLIEPGLKLRNWRRDDAEALVRHANDAEVAYYTSHRFPHPYTEIDAQKFLRSRRKAGSGVSLAIEVDGEAAGGIAVTLGEGTEAHCAELGYWLGRRHWGRGLMSRVVANFVPWVMTELQIVRLEAQVVVDNQASCALLQRLGFEREARMNAAVYKHGRYADAFLYSLVRLPIQQQVERA
ncbi:GNAT family N-acetyltransferase [Pseudomarimonas arenosa]|uniref:GNAT family N-acetyltransferase n=1 Tax=Pseudomarimonas arenosa TaxID=2774145 RepID=A0AAW3ZI93_9GAMM|nr:GNAT family N-acetyltransferase [Pseudomarimonas arenosa]MBD8524201.1 GNAT family N-acetyltransferase [Pseudomarimonas arenosa]